MHCPGCGQQQISNDTKFCSRCGLPLGLVSQVLAYGGYLPQLADLDKKKPSIFTRRNGMGFSLIWLIFFLAMTALGGGIGGSEEFGGAMALIGVFGGLILFVSSLIFLPGKQKFPILPASAYGFAPSQMSEPLHHAALPPQQSIPVSSYGPPQAGNWRDTNDLVPSVTENTTKLLEKEEER